MGNTRNKQITKHLQQIDGEQNYAEPNFDF